MARQQMFAKLVARALDLRTEEQFDTLCRDADRLFDQERITFEEHELVFRLLDKVASAVCS